MKRFGAQVLNAMVPVTVGIAVLLLWHAVVVLWDIPKYIIPSPAVVARTLIEDWDLLFRALLATLGITLAALLLAVVAGVAIAFLFVQSRWIERAFFPYAVLLQVTPIIAIAPLVIIWIKNTQLALTLCASIVAIFPIISNTTLGLRSVNTGLTDLFRMYEANRMQTLLRLRVPSALPYFFGGLRISSGLALIGAVVAEFVAGTGGSGSGLAYQILLAGLQLNIPRLFASLALITAAGVVLFLAMGSLSKLALRHWHESEVVHG